MICPVAGCMMSYVTAINILFTLYGIDVTPQEPPPFYWVPRRVPLSITVESQQIAFEILYWETMPLPPEQVSNWNGCFFG